jgi:hypothetical protein
MKAKKTEVSHKDFFTRPSSAPKDDETGDNTRSAQDMFSVKSDIAGRLSAVDLGILRISGLEKTKARNSRILDPYIRIEEYGDLKDTSIRIDGREIASPDLIVIEKYRSPSGGNEYSLSICVLWDNPAPERQTPEYWIPKNADTETSKYARGNPDGSVSLFLYLAEDSENVLEMRTADSGELLSVSMTFRAKNAREIREITGEIGDLCGLKEPLRTGRWFWRKNGGIPDTEMKRLKSFIDGGLVQWREISEWNGFPVIDGHVGTWNGVLLSLKLVVGKENSEGVLKILEPISKNGGFSLEAVEEGRIVKILAADRFVLNFSSLWEF